MNTTKTALAALAALGLAAVAVPSHAAVLPLPFTSTFVKDILSNGYFTQTVTITNPYTFTLSNMVVTETLLSDPTSFLSTGPYTVAPGASAVSDVDFLLPYGGQPENTQISMTTGAPLPFVVSITANDPNGTVYSGSLTQTYNPDGTPAAVPESGTMALLAGGLGLLGLVAIRRKRVG